MNFDLILISNLLPIEIFFIFAIGVLCLAGFITILSICVSKLIIGLGTGLHNLLGE